MCTRWGSHRTILTRECYVDCDCGDCVKVERGLTDHHPRTRRHPPGMSHRRTDCAKLALPPPASVSEPAPRTNASLVSLGKTDGSQVWLYGGYSRGLRRWSFRLAAFDSATSHSVGPEGGLFHPHRPAMCSLADSAGLSTGSESATVRA